MVEDGGNRGRRNFSSCGHSTHTRTHKHAHTLINDTIATMVYLIDDGRDEARSDRSHAIYRRFLETLPVIRSVYTSRLYYFYAAECVLRDPGKRSGRNLRNLQLGEFLPSKRERRMYHGEPIYGDERLLPIQRGSGECTG